MNVHINNSHNSSRMGHVSCVLRGNAELSCCLHPPVCVAVLLCSLCVHQPLLQPFHLLLWIFFCYHTLDWMIHLEGTLKCTLELREEENDPVGEFLCITGHYTSGLRATHPPLTKMRDQQSHFLPGSNGRNVECVFRTGGFRCSMSGNYSKATLWILAQNPFIMQWPEVIYGEMRPSAVK